MQGWIVAGPTLTLEGRVIRGVLVGWQRLTVGCGICQVLMPGLLSLVGLLRGDEWRGARGGGEAQTEGGERAWVGDIGVRSRMIWGLWCERSLDLEEHQVDSAWRGC
jgi:hypothetical protein